MKVALVVLVLIVGACYSQITLPLDGSVIVSSSFDYNQSIFHQTFIYNVTLQGFQYAIICIIKETY